MSRSQPTLLPATRPANPEFLLDVLRGLGRTPKELSCKYFYDAAGSRLFDRICELDEYYPTRTELGILRRHAGEMAGAIGKNALIVEYGSGSSLKTRVLLDRLHAPAAYVPVDICEPHLLQAARALAERYPAIPIVPVCADYTADIELPESLPPSARTVAFFPGSTIGNFRPREASLFLERVHHLCGPGGALLIGVDLKKHPSVLHAAYNDDTGVTARFNLNLLARINRELQADFDLARFAHYACYNPRLGRIEMYLVSLAVQVVTLSGKQITFREGESILTECSYKYTIDDFAALAAPAGFRLERTWTDPDRLFSMLYLTVSMPDPGARMAKVPADRPHVAG